VYWNFAEYVDFDTIGNPFIDAGGLPVEPDVNASNFTGTQPWIFLTGGAAAFGTNRGAGDDLIAEGGPVDGVAIE